MSETVNLATAARIIGEQVMTLKRWRFLGVGPLAELGTRPGRDLELDESEVLHFALVAAVHGGALSLVEAAAKADSLMSTLTADDFGQKSYPVYAVEVRGKNIADQYIVEGHAKLQEFVTEFADALAISILNLSELRIRVHAGLTIAAMGAVAFKEWAAAQHREGKIDDSNLAAFNKLADQVAPPKAPRTTAARSRRARVDGKTDRPAATAS